MTLSRQLLMLLTALVLLLFAGTLTISVYNTRSYLESQLASHAQDAATSLGLSATTHVANDDKAMVTTMVNAMFHRGDYLSIRFENLDGQAWIERIVDLKVADVPAWFRRAFVLEPPQRSATMMSGWHQVGRVVVTSHPGLAYQQLWQTTVHTLRLFLVGALLALLLGVIGLRLLLRPLKAVEMQADAICNREFPVLEKRPFTLELRRVVEAMNRLSSKVARMLSDAEESAGRLRQQAYQDPVTGLANRRQLMDVLAHRTGDSELLQTGGLLLLELNDFKAYNQEHGYSAGDRLLHAAGRAIESVLAGEPRSTLARLSGASFSVLVENVDAPRLHALGSEIVAAVAGLYGRLALESSDVAHVGIALYAGQSASELLSEADLALREAQRDGANAVVLQRHATDDVAVRTASDWRELIETAITRRQFSLLRQPVLACDGGGLLHHEVFLRLADPLQPEADIAAAVFMPMAESVGLAATVDRAVCEAVVVGVEAGSYPGRVAVNLSATSLGDAALLDWLAHTLSGHSAAAQRLILEFPEYGVAAQVDVLASWIARLGPLGVRFSLDHFGKGFTAFAYLRTLKVDYLKVDGSFVRQLPEQDDNRFFLRAIADIGHGLDMQVIAESVETENDWEALRGLGLDGGRGYWLGRPE